MNWKEMDPRARDALVATKIFGWEEKPCDLEETDEDLIIYDSGDCYCPRCYADGHISDFAHGMMQPSHYTSSMDKAWLVLQHMVERYCVNAPQRNEVWDRFCEATWEGYMESGNIYRWVARWTPEGLCLAALRAIGIELI